ncbi:MAG: PAS domain S-box protein [Acidobacteria bacterium]|nr:PAS domain S-box protein [Acidobacteriota bacterium]
MSEESRTRRAATPWWFWFTMLLPLAFLGWCGWMFLLVQESRVEDTGRLAAQEKLNQLEQSLVRLQQGSIVLWRIPIASQSLEHWRELYRDYRAQVKQLDGKDPAIRDVMENLLKVYAAVGRTERIRQQLLMSKVPEEEARGLEAEFRSKLDVALADLKAAKLKLGTGSATTSRLGMWTVFALGAAGLALLTALTLVVLGRQLARTARTEVELADNWRDVHAVESRWQTVIKSAPDAFLVTDDKGEVQAANLGVQNLIGYTPPELVGRALSVVLPALGRKKAPEGAEPGWVETEVRRRDGESVLLDAAIRKTPINGEPATVVVLRPAGKGRAEESLRRERDFLNAVFEGGDVMIAMLDAQGCVTGINPALERKSGLGPAAVLGRRFRELFKLDPLPVEGGAARFPAPHGLSWLVRHEARRRVIWQGAELAGKDGAIQHIVALGTDVTDFVDALAPAPPAPQTAEILGDLAARVSQTLGDALTTISGYSELLLDSLKPEDPSRRDAEQILEASERAATVTRRLLSFTQQQLVQAAPMDVNARVEGISRKLASALGPGVRLRTELEEQLAHVEMDPERFDELLFILASNARDAMPRGGTATLRTAQTRAADESVWVTVSVRDTGTGIDAGTQKRLFQPFFTTKDPRTALGLGLATVRGIVARSGGKIRVETTPGAGTNVSILLPPLSAAPRARPAGTVASGRQA